MRLIGKSVKRIDAVGKVTGETQYPGDINKPNQAYAKILFAGRPHAIIKELDTGKAEKLEGVLGIFTARDVPVNEYGLTMKDQPVLCGPGAAKPFTDRVRFEGDQLAIIVAESEDIAAQARDMIEVEFEDLPLVTDPLEARKPGATLLHPERESNVYYEYKIRKGDVDEAFKQCDVIVEGEYETPRQEHLFLAPESGLGYIDEEGRVTVAVAGQWAHIEQEAISHALDLPLEQVRVIHPAIGGAFGGREDMSIQITLALAAWRLHQRGIERPIKLIWSRQESIIGHHKRHHFIIRSKWGATKDGFILAAESEVIADAGAYNYTTNKVLGNAHFAVSGAYVIPNVKVDSYGVYTNNVPGGAFRGFGGPQGAFAAEMQVAKLAEELGMDPVELRLKNIVKDGAIFHTQSTLPSPVTIERVVEECAKAGGWQKSADGWQLKNKPQQPADSHIKRGIGIACGLKNVGFSLGFPERSWATVEIHGTGDIERVVVHHAGADVGQGAHSLYRQMTAEAVGVPLESVELMVADTAVTGDSGSTSASRMTFMSGNAIRGAAKLALEKWQEEERPAIATFNYNPPATTPYDKETGASENPNFAYGYVAEVIEAEVDTETGEVRLLNVICADDVGKALNPQQVEGQIEGAVVQAAGYALLENLVMRDGHILSDKMSTYLIPTVLDVPDKVQSLILEYADEEGPWGARGMAEMPYIPFAPAVAAAVKDATGVWFNDFPLTPERVLRGLGKI